MVYPIEDSLSETINFTTDTAILAIFDPTLLKHHLNNQDIWWSAKFNRLPEVKTGLITLVRLGRSGGYKVRLTNGFLTSDEKDFAREETGPLGLVSKAGQVFVGAGEVLPCDNYLTSPSNIRPGNGRFMLLDVGEYNLQIYSIVGFAAGKLPASLPDIVIEIRRRQAKFADVPNEPQLFFSTENFLFPSPGMQINT